MFPAKIDSQRTTKSCLASLCTNIPDMVHLDEPRKSQIPLDHTYKHPELLDVGGNCIEKRRRMVHVQTHFAYHWEKLALCLSLLTTC